MSYAGEYFLTGSEIAHALLEYAQALAQVQASATVRIPTVDASGRAGSSEVLVGPASQLISSAVEVDVPDPEDAELLAHLRESTAALHIERAPIGGADAETPALAADYLDDYDL